MKEKEKEKVIRKFIKELYNDFGVFYELDKEKNKDYQICDHKLEVWIKNKLEEIL